MNQIVAVAISLLTATLSANEAAVSWQLAEPLTYEQFCEGKLITFHGRCAEKFSRPEIDDFRLERLSPAKTWIPMIFGRQWELNWPRDSEITKVHLHVRCPRAPKQAAKDEAGMPLYAETWIEANASYRLSWNRRHSQGSTMHYVSFQLAGKPHDAEAQWTYPGQAYLCEVVYNHNDVQFLGRTVRPSLHLDNRRHEMQAVGFSDEGRHVAPPDPGYARLKQVEHQVESTNRMKLKPPPAATTHYLGFALEDEKVTVYVSDVATSGQLPLMSAKPTFILFEENLYRIELLTKNVEVLRQDRGYWQQRIRAIQKEWKLASQQE